ncbi:MAG: transcriptional regulator, partial [Candidatus Lokiarchaeota archaeon]
MDDVIIKPYSLIVVSPNKISIIQVLENKVLTPKGISIKTNIRINHISAYLTDLKEENIVICLNEDKKRGRLYELTNLGKKVLSEL